MAVPAPVVQLELAELVVHVRAAVARELPAAENLIGVLAGTENVSEFARARKMSASAAHRWRYKVLKRLKSYLAQWQDSVSGFLVLCWLALVARAKPAAAFLVVAAVGWSLYCFAPRAGAILEAPVAVPVTPSRAADPLPAPPVDPAPVAPAVVGAESPVTLSAPRAAARVTSPVRVRGEVGEIDYEQPGSKVWLAVRDAGRLYFKKDVSEYSGRSFDVPVVQRDGPCALVIVRVSAADHATVLDALETEKRERQARGFAAGALPSAQVLGAAVEIVVVAP
ncbi:MAG: hypothetical protein FJ304_06965 [Planctomycetes bacterium]|nr:hypothetical protein [Planctomycetota bacterium]